MRSHENFTKLEGSGIIFMFGFSGCLKLAKILLVEDDELLSQSLAALLETEKHKVDVVANGLTACEYLLQYEYDLVVLDWQLPGQSGIDVCRKFREAGGLSYILMLTGLDSFEQKEQGLDTGADDYMTKPFDQRELFARIRALLRRPRAVSSDVLKAGRLKLETASHELLLDEAPVKLMPLEYSLLEFMWRNHGQVYSCEDLLKKLWTADDEVSLQSVYSCINRLRSKLRAKGIGDLIQTVHGSGYKFVQPG